MSFNDKQLISAVLQGISIKNKKILTNDEKLFLINKIKHINMEILRGKKISDIISSLVTLLSNDLKSIPKMDNSPIDMREVFKEQLGIEPETALLSRKIDPNETIDSLLQQPLTLQGIFNPQALHKKAYILLDRKYQSNDVNNINEFKWNISSINKPYDSASAVATALFKDVIKIKVFPFRFPYASNLNSNTHRINIEFVEFNTQSYIIAHNHKKFHVTFDIQKTSNLVGTYPYDLIDIGNANTEFEFSDPIISVDTLTLRFSNLNNVINLDPDNLNATISALGVQTLLTFSQLHWCALGDYVIISNFTTSSPSTDLVEIELMNGLDGWPIINIPTPNQILIDVDISGLSGAIIGNPFNIYLDSKRFVARVELTYIAK